MIYLKKNIKILIIKFINFFFPPKKLNIGSGIRNWFGWDMYDEVSYPLIKKIKFTPKTRLKKKKYNFILLSHFIEHICDKSFDNIIKETYKASHANTLILIKYPNYELFYESLYSKKKEIKLMKITEKNFAHYFKLWKAYNVKDCIENRVSMMFCDYSNIYFKNQYQDGYLKNLHKLAYHGPAIIDINKTRKIFKNKNFKNIQLNLKKEILKDKKFYKFNHTNIWNKTTLINILKKKFKIISLDKNFIYNQIKGYLNKDEFYFLNQWSSYILLKKKN